MSKHRAREGRFASRGSKAYDALIDRRELTSRAAGLQLKPKASRVAVHAIRHGQSRPQPDMQLRIAEWSRERDRQTGDLGPPTIVLADWLLKSEEKRANALDLTYQAAS